LSFGLFASVLSRNTMNQLVHVSGILLIVMGVMMVDRGLTLTHAGDNLGSLPPARSAMLWDHRT